MSKIKTNENFEALAAQDHYSDDSNLDINIIIATFQEKLSSLMTDLVIKEATIKQQAKTISRLKGQSYE